MIATDAGVVPVRFTAPSSGTRGLTLPEMLITLAVIATLLAVGVPSFRHTIQNNRLDTQINLLAGDLGYARSEAIKRAGRVGVCKRNNAGSACDNASTWERGWIVFTDGNGNGALDDDGNATPCETGEDCLLRVQEPLSGGNTLSYPGNWMTFDADGFAGGFAGTFILCDSRGTAYARGRTLTNEGRLRATVDSNNDGAQEDASGVPLSCP